LIDKEALGQFNFNMTDVFTDDLFNAAKYQHIKAKYSRIFCDVERRIKPAKELMSKYGMGVIYTKDLEGKTFIQPDKQYKKDVINNYYKQYHKNLTEIIKSEIKDNTVVLVDCHSFSNETLKCFGKISYVPDICIGVNYISEYNMKLITLVVYYFEQLGYDVMLNYPYSGSMVPNKINEKKANNFYSIMIEINKRLYLWGINKSPKYNELKSEINTLLKMIEAIDLR
jgi:N-formylglutamate amidohydrolase